MINTSQPFTEAEFDELATRPPTLHKPSDCVALVRRMIATAEHIVEGGGDVERNAFGGATLQTASEQTRRRTEEHPQAPTSQAREQSEAVGAVRRPRDVRRGPARAFTIESADRIAASLRALPSVDPSRRALNKQELVRRLAGEIALLQRRGYTLEEVAESLRSSDMPITTSTLKSYLQRSKRSNASRSGRRRGRSNAETAGVRDGALTAEFQGEPPRSTADRRASDLPRAADPIDVWADAFGSPVTIDREVQVDDDDDPLWDLPDL